MARSRSSAPLVRPPKVSHLAAFNVAGVQTATGQWLLA